MSNDKVDSTADDRTINNDVRHQYRVLSAREQEAVRAIKDGIQDLMNFVDEFVPADRERALAKTKLEEAVMWAVKGITK